VQNLAHHLHGVLDYRRVLRYLKQIRLRHIAAADHLEFDRHHLRHRVGARIRQTRKRLFQVFEGGLEGHFFLLLVVHTVDDQQRLWLRNHALERNVLFRFAKPHSQRGNRLGSVQVSRCRFLLSFSAVLRVISRRRLHGRRWSNGFWRRRFRRGCLSVVAPFRSLPRCFLRRDSRGFCRRLCLCFQPRLLFGLFARRLDPSSPSLNHAAAWRVVRDVVVPRLQNVQRGVLVLHEEVHPPLHRGLEERPQLRVQHQVQLVQERVEVGRKVLLQVVREEVVAIPTLVHHVGNDEVAPVLSEDVLHGRAVLRDVLQEVLQLHGGL